MQGNKNQGYRRSIRLENYDYSQEGAYFVTICTQDKKTIFGKIKNGEVILNSTGDIAQEEWYNTKSIRKNVSLDEFVIMPNHIHGIIVISEPVGATRCVAQSDKRAT